MVGLTLKSAKEGFFDRPKVLGIAGEASVKVLSRQGALVWKIARRSIRKRKKPSQPGSPPSSHVGLLKDMMFFSYDDSSRSVVIGPVLINKPTGAPRTLEFGGDTEIEEHKFRYRGGKRVYLTVRKKVTIKARPYMGPALEAAKPYLEKTWQNSIR